MKAKYLALGVAVGLAVGLMIYMDYLENEKQDKIIEDIEKAIAGQYNGTISEIVHEGSCIVCTRFGCESLGEECWKANVTTPTSLVRLAMNSQGQILDDQEMSFVSNPDAGPSQNPEECTGFYTEESGLYTLKYTNTGCLNPTPTCSGGGCTICSSQEECIGLVETLYQGQAIQTEMVITSTPYTGYYNYSSGKCVIDDSSIAIYDNVTDFGNCYDVVVSHVECDDGFCDFI